MGTLKIKVSTYLWDPRSTSIGCEHAHQEDRDGSKPHAPEYKHEISDDICHGIVGRLVVEECRPWDPLGAVVGAKEGGVPDPAAFLAVEPESIFADTKLEVTQPTGTNVNYPCASSYV